eukprot:PITA_03055
MEIRAINVYGLCQHNTEFWDYLLNFELCQKDFLIMGGDLNFSIGHVESWGRRAKIDPLSVYFENVLGAQNLMEIPITKMQPTWQNNRTAEDSLASRLNRFHIKEGLLSQGLIHRRWVGLGGISNHLPIYIEISGGQGKSKGPFKFCATWLKEPSYVSLASSHFKQIYRAPPIVNLAEIIQVAQLFPCFLDQEEGRELIKEVTLEDLEATLKWFKKDKSHGPDGWTVEFYLEFFEILGLDLLKVVEDSRANGKMYEPFNATFIALIPKIDNPNSFNDYKPISLCNCIYKIMAKIISNSLRPILSTHISQEQFAFLQEEISKKWWEHPKKLCTHYITRK